MGARRQALLIASIYVAIALLWITLSDYFVLLLSEDQAKLATRLQTTKGVLYVLLTGVLLYGLAHPVLARRQRLEMEARAAEQRLAGLLAVIPHGIEEIDLEGTITFSNAAHGRMVGYAPDELVGRKVWELVPERDRTSFRAYIAQLIREQPEPEPWFGITATRDGRAIHTRVDWNYRRDPDGRLLGISTVITDVSAEQAYQERLRQVGVVFDNAAEAILITDPDGTLLRVNRAFKQLTGYSEREVVGKPVWQLRSGTADDGFYGGVWKALAGSGRWQGEVWNRRRGGELFPMWMSITAVRAGDGPVTAYVAVASDLTTAKETEQRMEQLAHYDPLTSLPNRLLFEARLVHALQRARGVHGKVALLTIDLDRFKTVNESLGHVAGDAILLEVASRLKACVGEQDTLARPGGDEFVIILEAIDDSRPAVAAAGCVLDALAAPILAGGQEVFMSASIGIGLYPIDADDAPMLVRNAEAAMYRAKESGRANYQFYTAELTSRAFERLSLETSLRHAIDRDELVVHYQPQISLESGLVTGVEALVRWEHPERGLVPPIEFIPLAEESGLIHSLGLLVLRKACRQAVRWQRDGLPPLRMAVNLSGQQVAQAGLVDEVRQVLEETGLDPHLLELEITETAIMRSPQEAEGIMTALKAMGICIAVDDFGTGYSSMNYLKRFAVDRLKVDRSFVIEVATDPSDQAIARTIVALAHSLNLTAIAEGVETEEQRAFLQTIGCNEMQGYLFSQPVSAERIPALLTTGTDQPDPVTP